MRLGQCGLGDSIGEHIGQYDQKRCRRHQVITQRALLLLQCCERGRRPVCGRRCAVCGSAAVDYLIFLAITCVFNL